MGSDDGICPFFLQQLADIFLGVADGVVVLTAPMDQSNGNIRLLLPGIAHNVGDLIPVDLGVDAAVVGIEHIDAVLIVCAGDGVTVHTLGEGHHRNAHTLHFKDRNALLMLKFRFIAEYAHRLHTCLLHRVDGGQQTGHALIDGVGVGKLDHIHAHVF